MPATDQPRCTLIGGGLGGALLAAYLGQAGYETELFERRPDPAAGNTVGGRSINLAISVRGIHALEQIGAAETVLRQAIPMRGRMIHAPGGGVLYQPYDKDPSRHINSVGRGALNTALLQAAQASPSVRVHFDWKCTDVDLDRAAAELEHVRTGEKRSASGDLLFGIDGAFSVVRRAMQRLDRCDYSQKYLGHGYKELCIPPAASGDFAMEPHALHIWPRRRYMMIALPNADRSFTCTLFYAFDGPESFAALRTRDDVQRLFERSFSDALPLMPTLLDDFERNPVGAMVTVRCRPWTTGGRVALLGDAAHAVVPFYGQGANAAFEDCTVLTECLRRRAPDWGAALREYDALRRENVDTLADLAIFNFIEMRDHTGSRVFRMRKRLERTLHTLLPGRYAPLYTLVSFTRTPYAEAVRRARAQDRAVAAVGLCAAAGLLALLLRGVAGTNWLESLTLATLLVLIAGALALGRARRTLRAAMADGMRGR